MADKEHVARVLRASLAKRPARMAEPESPFKKTTDAMLRFDNELNRQLLPEVQESTLQCERCRLQREESRLANL